LILDVVVTSSSAAATVRRLLLLTPLLLLLPPQCDVSSLLAIDFQTRALILLLNIIIYEINELR